MFGFDVPDGTYVGLTSTALGYQLIPGKDPNYDIICMLILGIGWDSSSARSSAGPDYCRSSLP